MLRRPKRHQNAPLTVSPSDGEMKYTLASFGDFVPLAEAMAGTREIIRMRQSRTDSVGRMLVLYGVSATRKPSVG